MEGVVRARAPGTPGAVRPEAATVVAGGTSPPRALAHGLDPHALLPRQLAACHPPIKIEALMQPAVGLQVSVPDGVAELVEVSLHLLVLLGGQQAANRLCAPELHGRVKGAHVAQLLRDIHSRVFAEVRHGKPREVLLALGATICGQAWGERGKRGPRRLITDGQSCSSEPPAIQDRCIRLCSGTLHKGSLGMCGRVLPTPQGGSAHLERAPG